MRLWLPAAASTTFAVVAMLLVPRSENPALGRWMTITHPTGLGARQMLMEYLLIPKHAYRNTVLWSLHAEAIFSFVLPLMILGWRCAPAGGSPGCRWWPPWPYR